MLYISPHKEHIILDYVLSILRFLKDVFEYLFFLLITRIVSFIVIKKNVIFQVIEGEE